MGGQDGGLADVALAALKDRLATETGPEYLRAAIIGAGNSGDASLLPALQPYIANSDVDLRVEAAHALRQMPMAATGQTFADWIGAEKQVLALIGRYVDAAALMGRR